MKPHTMNRRLNKPRMNADIRGCNGRRPAGPRFSAAHSIPIVLVLFGTCSFAYLLCPATWAEEETKIDAGANENKESWPLFRGDAEATGVAHTTLPDQPALLWKYEVPGGAFEATAVLDGGALYLGDLDGAFYALDLATGQLRWKQPGEIGYAAAAGVRDGRVYVGDIEGRFHSFDAATGEKRWTFEAEAEINGGPNFQGDRVIFGSQDARLYCLDGKTGQLVWKHETDDQIRCFPSLVGGNFLVAGCDGSLHAIRATDGKEVGKIAIGAPTGSTPAKLGQRVYFGTEGAEFLAVDLDKSEIAWRFRARRTSHSFRSSAAVQKDYVVFGGRDRRVHALDPTTGEKRWEFATQGYVDGSPVIVGQRVFVGSQDGRLYAIDLKSGEKVWEYQAGGRFTASPAVAAGRLVIANENGIVYCFGKSK